jgi:dienelactone hydrolase
MRLPFFVIMLALAGCQTASPPELAGDALRPTLAELRRDLLRAKGDLATFETRGPLSTRVYENCAVTLADGTTLVYDQVIPTNPSPSEARPPLAVLVHGNHSRKEAHRRQAERLASFGFTAVALEVPNRDQWVLNGILVKRFVKAVTRAPGILAADVDARRVVLIGHSFGGSAVTIAAALGAPVQGLVLLDPAVVSPTVVRLMPRVKVPVMLLGADKTVFRSRRRAMFFRELGGPMLEVSVVGATHDDAQNPSMYALTTYGVDPFTSPDRQALFQAALTAGAFSLAATGALDYAEEATDAATDDGLLKESRSRPAPARRSREAAVARWEQEPG